MKTIDQISIGIVGATGIVGQTFINLIEKSPLQVKKLRPFASKKGSSCHLHHRDWPIQTLTRGCFKDLDFVFFASNEQISRKWVPQAVDQGAFAIDNSSFFRLDYPLIVPEINGQLLSQKTLPRLIANPNCSTIQLVLALYPLKKFGLKEVHIASYQSVSGAGKSGLNEWLDQTKAFIKKTDVPRPKTFRHPIAFNCLPEIGTFNSDGYCSEEVKIINETRKILDLPLLKISAFTVRVPTKNVHSEAVWVCLEEKVSRDQIIESLKTQKSLHVHNDPTSYPHVHQVNGSFDVHVGRIHRDVSDAHTWRMWVVGDNLLKGAALNGLQIAQHIYQI